MHLYSAHFCLYLTISQFLPLFYHIGKFSHIIRICRIGLDWIGLCCHSICTEFLCAYKYKPNRKIRKKNQNQQIFSNKTQKQLGTLSESMEMLRCIQCALVSNATLANFMHHLFTVCADSIETPLYIGVLLTTYADDMSCIQSATGILPCVHAFSKTQVESNWIGARKRPSQKTHTHTHTVTHNHIHIVVDEQIPTMCTGTFRVAWFFYFH